MSGSSASSRSSARPLGSEVAGRTRGRVPGTPTKTSHDHVATRSRRRVGHDRRAHRPELGQTATSLRDSGYAPWWQSLR